MLWIAASQYAQVCKYADWTELKIGVIRAIVDVTDYAAGLFLVGFGFGAAYVIGRLVNKLHD